MGKITFHVEKIQKVKIRTNGKTYYSYRIHIPSRYIRDGHLDPNKPCKVTIEQED